MKTYIKTINNLQFTVNAEEALQPQVQTLFQIIENIPPGDIRDGYKIEVGWTVFSLVKTQEGFCIVAPDYRNNPFAETTDDLTLAFWVQLEQTHFLRQYKLEGESVRFSDKIVVAKGVLKEEKISMQRFADCSKGDSGWCVESTTNESADDYEALFAYQLLFLRPALVKALVLPYEYIVVYDGDVIEAIIDPNDNNIV